MSGATTQLVWAAVLIVAVPLTVVVVGEVSERLRQAGSPLAPAVSLVRTLVLPLVVAYLLVRALLGMGDDHSVGRLLATALVLASFVVALNVVRTLVVAVKRRAHAEQRTAPPQLLLALPRIVLVLVGVWLLFGVVWGVELSRALTALGVTSLIISLALQQPLGALASGFLLLSDQPFRTGEWIRVGDLEGRVIDINWRTTRVENRDGDLMVLPNAHLSGATIINYDQPARLHRIVLPVQAAFSNPPSRVIAMLLAAARSTPGVLADPAPDVKVVQVDDPLMGYELQVWIDDHTHTPRIRSQMAALVWYSSERLGVPLPSPAQDLYLWDGVATAAGKVVGADAVRRHLSTSPMTAGLPDADLDLLASAARYELFCAGETMLDLERADPDDLRIIVSGHAAIVAEFPEGDAVTVSELEQGDVFGLLRRDHLDDVAPQVVALADCEVVTVAAATAAIVIGRTPALSDALHRLATSRRRRLERLSAGLRPADGAASVEGST
jgi:small-conductance mechanosensitive channel/CRP-like cAMP-binding protein